MFFIHIFDIFMLANTFCRIDNHCKNIIYLLLRKKISSGTGNEERSQINIYDTLSVLLPSVKEWMYIIYKSLKLSIYIFIQYAYIHSCCFIFSNNSSTDSTITPPFLQVLITCKYSNVDSIFILNPHYFSIFFFLAFIIFCKVAKRGSFNRKSAEITAESTDTLCAPPSTSLNTSACSTKKEKFRNKYNL